MVGSSNTNANVVPPIPVQRAHEVGGRESAASAMFLHVDYESISIVDVADTKSPSGETFTLYMIEVELSNGHWWRVPHRYSEFLQLKTQLQALLPKKVFPPFPGKKIFGSKEQDTVKTRRRLLEKFLQHVVEDLFPSEESDSAVETPQSHRAQLDAMISSREGEKHGQGGGGSGEGGHVSALRETAAGVDDVVDNDSESQSSRFGKFFNRGGEDSARSIRTASSRQSSHRQGSLVHALMSQTALERAKVVVEDFLRENKAPEPAVPGIRRPASEIYNALPTPPNEIREVGGDEEVTSETTAHNQERRNTGLPPPPPREGSQRIAAPPRLSQTISSNALDAALKAEQDAIVHPAEELRRQVESADQQLKDLVDEQKRKISELEEKATRLDNELGKAKRDLMSERHKSSELDKLLEVSKATETNTHKTLEARIDQLQKQLSEEADKAAQEKLELTEEYDKMIGEIHDEFQKYKTKHESEVTEEKKKRLEAEKKSTRAATEAEEREAEIRRKYEELLGDEAKLIQNLQQKLTKTEQELEMCKQSETLLQQSLDEHLTKKGKKMSIRKMFSK